MEFNEAIFGKELEAILEKHKTEKGISWGGIKNFMFEARNHTNGLFGERSIDIMPIFIKKRNSYKMTIYVSPDPKKYGWMFDYHFNLPVQK